MPGYTLASTEALMRSLIFEATGDTGLVSATQAQELIQLANRQLTGEIMDLSPSLYAKRSADKSIASTGLDFSGTSLDSVGVYKLMMLEYKDSGGNYRQLSPIAYLEKDQVEGPAWQIAPEYTAFRWTVLGEKIYLYPLPSGTATVRVTYLPVTSDIADGGTPVPPLGGKLLQYQEIVGYLAAVMALEKDEKTTPIFRRYDHMHKRLVEFARNRQVQRPRRIMMTEAEE